MNYKPYVERNADGSAKSSRKARKGDRRNVFLHNQKEHSKRVKRERREAAAAEAEGNDSGN